jgi:hypothetical protein
MNNEQQLLIDEAYENYCKEYENGTHRIGTGLLWMAKETKDTFVYRSKTDSKFSEKWGLKIEERELIDKERIELAGGRIQDKYPALVEMSLRVCDERDIPTQLITITYNDKAITSYE